MERLVHIDILKGIAIIMVVMGHMFVPYTSYLDSSVNQLIYSVHMPLFFFLSGYVFHLKLYGKFEVIRTICKRTLTLLLPFLSFSALYCFAYSLSYGNMIVNNEMHNGYWFTLVLWEIILISILFELLLGARKTLRNDAIVNSVVIILFLFVAKQELIPEPIRTILSTDKVAKFYMFFQFGKFVGSYGSVKKLFQNKWVYLLGFVCYFYIFCKYGYNLQFVNIYSFILPFCGIILISNVVEQNVHKLNYKGFLQYIGRNSLEIYLIHFFLLSTIPGNIINCFGIVYFQLVVLLLLSVFCIVISLVIAKFIHNSSLLSLILLGKGILLNKILFSNK